MTDIMVTSIDNKRYIKIDEYEAFLTKKNSNNSTESIEYKERLIEYEKDYKGFNSYQNWNRLEIFY